MPPLVSVIIPTYNRWPMLCEAIDSVLGQSYPYFELIVVDDGSEDGTRANLDGCESRIRFFSQSRQGVAAARNTGIRASTGRYLAFLDSDDLWKPKKLERQVGFMGSHPEAEICQTEEIWLRRGARVNPKERHRKPSGDVFRASLDLCLVSPSAVMMTRELFDGAGGFDESLAVCEDYDLWLRIAVKTPIFLLSEALVVKRGGHADQLSRSTWGLDRFRVLALRKLLASELSAEKREWVIDVLRRKSAILAQGARKRGREEEARGYESILGELKDRESRIEDRDPSSSIFDLQP